MCRGHFIFILFCLFFILFHKAREDPDAPARKAREGGSLDTPMREAREGEESHDFPTREAREGEESHDTPARKSARRRGVT